MSFRANWFPILVALVWVLVTASTLSAASEFSSTTQSLRPGASQVRARRFLRVFAAHKESPHASEGSVRNPSDDEGSGDAVASRAFNARARIHERTIGWVSRCAVL